MSTGSSRLLWIASDHCGLVWCYWQVAGRFIVRLLAGAAYGSADAGGHETLIVGTRVKIWVDARGLGGVNVAWKPGHEPCDFDPAAWLRVRSAREFDLDDIGALAVPVPTEAELASAVSNRYAFLTGLDAEQRQLAQTREQDRDLALRLLAKLPGARLAHVGLY